MNKSYPRLQSSSFIGLHIKTLYSLTVATGANYHRFVASKPHTFILFRCGGQKPEVGLTGKHHHVVRAVFFLGAVEQNLIHAFWGLLVAAHIPWLLPSSGDGSLLPLLQLSHLTCLSPSL